MDIYNVVPSIKTAYPVIYKKNCVYIGGFGEVTKYNDTEGGITELFKLMNGKNTVSKILEKMLLKYPQYDKNEIIEVINAIGKEGFIEDLNHVGSDILTNYELCRYHRNINLFSSYTNLNENKYLIQKKLIEAKIGIIRLGGLGSHIVYDLAGLGIGTIKAVEFDTVEISNLNRQILYNYEEIGKSKAEIAQEKIKKFNPNINFSVVEEKITNADDVVKHFKGFDLVILVADRPKVKLARWVNEGIVRLNIPLFCAGLEGKRGLQYTIVPSKTGCIDCWRDNVRKNDYISSLILDERTRLNLTGDNTAIAPLVSIVTGFVCSEVLKYITGIGEISLGKLKSIDLDTLTTKIAEIWEINENCPTCSKKGETNE